MLHLCLYSGFCSTILHPDSGNYMIMILFAMCHRDGATPRLQGKNRTEFLELTRVLMTRVSPYYAR